MKNLYTYLEKTRNAKLVEEYNQLLEKQPDDIMMARSLQKELSGQSTMICFDVDTSMRIGMNSK